MYSPYYRQRLFYSTLACLCNAQVCQLVHRATSKNVLELYRRSPVQDVERGCSAVYDHQYPQQIAHCSHVEPRSDGNRPPSAAHVWR